MSKIVWLTTITILIVSAAAASLISSLAGAADSARNAVAAMSLAELHGKANANSMPRVGSIDGHW